MRFAEDSADEERIGSRDLTQWHTRAGRWLASTAVRYAGRLGSWGAANAVLLLTAGVGLAVAVLLTAAASEVYEGVVESDGISGLDRPVLDWSVAHRTPWLEGAVTAYTDLGGPVGMTVFATVAALALALLWRSRTPVVLLAIAATGSLALTSVGKGLVGRVRPPGDLAVPPLETSPSFPSGHTLNATVVFGVLAYLVLRRLDSGRSRAAVVAVGGLLTVAMGLSRAYLGHHWLSDVVMGWVVGLAWLVVVVTAHRMFLTVRRASVTSTPQEGPPPSGRPPRGSRAGGSRG